MKHGYVYIVSNNNNSVLYTGVTSDLANRINQHKNKTIKGFTSKYNCNKLVYYEIGNGMEGCILREKQIKAGSRQKKIQLIEGMNPQWKDLYDDIQ
ncbi:MAG: GIY-YIG nuclease family protein [Urechidicola sp.]|jgi:putative endonuclease|nr:GIY-YIG nuclease family protein [Urechidicola sp.]